MSDAFAPPESHLATARAKTAGPAITLMVLSSLWVLLLMAGTISNVILLASGATDLMDDPMGGSMSKETQVLIRTVLGLVFLALNGFIVYGANEMRRIGNLAMARVACTLAVIPCLGPCYLLGIPFGIWGMTVLSKPEVQEAFAERGA